ncbi:hypothetical protein AUK04_00215 [Candidatus Roizmanbacteria bacterium CG2_30_33_16]|uniref:Toxin n=3 Tax=Candidatus Roizmaniibacteriota TaxID=1752723 RepID=A0A2H0C505_9BACT|nr:toxin [Candidatus Roizmanbacteria bacterium]OIP86710.1 MAG: hypothetical protein AUK04_00215 [Candidatus Roizmanbacteria bacterium CG2_30_33_16]PIP64398.1 MAG: toxin [Candidatus Roizmanbacteria bacterium CG22_combo_CG10-13_8_21_14_all_33_16]PIX73776.1 MAG: toxin [Candidatus Roizmanbacteria bacterium CG_4_10_14_3_um_filter_33_21]
MTQRFEFNEEKNLILKKSRGVNFEDILQAIKDDKMLDDIGNGRDKYKHQRILVVKIKNYIYAVPYVKNSKGILFLKTLYPSRVLTKRYLNK